MLLEFTEHLLYARYCSEHLIFIISFNSYNIKVETVISIY